MNSGAHELGPEAWLAVQRGDDRQVAELARTRPPRETLFMLFGEIALAYQAAAAKQQPLEAAVARARRLLPALAVARRRAGPAQREIDLDLLRLMRRQGCVSPVLGAGVTKGAGGPLWSELVERLLAKATARGFDDVMTKRNAGISDLLAGTAERVVGVKRFTSHEQARALALLTRIRGGAVDTETLMRGAELCLELAGQRLFAEVTELLYANCAQPGPTHRVLAKIAETPPRWHAIVTYNFEDLMGEALDALALPRAALSMNGPVIGFAPNAQAKPLGRDGDYVRVLHLHGFTPRRFHYITHIKYVFATRQYEELYAADQRPLLDTAVAQCLAHPLRCALYVGCSFEDEAMNTLVRKAVEPHPGRAHYALLQWPGPGKYADATGERIFDAEQRYRAFGVQPIWFERFDELPELIAALE